MSAPSIPVPAPRRALVLAGGGARGAFEAGAIATLAAQEIEFGALIGTSAGALSAAFFAAAIRAGDPNGAAAELVDFWIEHAHWRTFVSLSPPDILDARGLSNTRQLEHVLLSRMNARTSAPAKRDVALRMIAAVLRPDEHRFALTSEHVFSFDTSDFARRPLQIARAAVASAAFPGVFAPVHVTGVGDCADGGLTAETPLAEALALPHIDEVYVVTGSSPSPPRRRLGGVALVGRWLEILLEERFQRSLLRVERAHGQLRALENLRARGTLTESHCSELREVLSLPPPRVVVIRPEEPLPGGFWGAFADKQLRAEYVAHGRSAAERVLSRQRAHVSEAYNSSSGKP